MRRTLRVTAIVLLLISVAGMATLQAASMYADPQFKAQWDQGEAITPNFWGPIGTAKDGQPEDYKETGGKRTVQYFDKGRMELTNGKVTNGLLASEIIKGQIQTGDATFTGQAPPAISIAGDPDNPGPTYATLATKAAALLAASTSKVGSPVAATVSATGDVTTPSAASSAPETAISAFDDTTKHNVPKVFADYRTKAGLQTIGFAISEPFMATVKVAGTQKPVMIQVFERRVLTYTASNDAAFRVEMGNIGQHYYQWRYPSGKAAAPAASPSTAAPSAASSSGVAGAKAPPTTSAPSGVATFDVKIIDVIPTVKIGDIETVNVQTNGKADCGIEIIYFGNKPVKDTRLTPPKRADDSGKVSWSWTVGSEAKAGAASFTVNCTVANMLGTAVSTFNVSG